MQFIWQSMRLAKSITSMAHISDANHQGPLDHQFQFKAGTQKRVMLKPPQDYFESLDNPHFLAINVALALLDNAKEEEWKKEKNCLHRELDQIMGEFCG